MIIMRAASNLDYLSPRARRRFQKKKNILYAIEIKILNTILFIIFIICVYLFTTP